MKLAIFIFILLSSAIWVGFLSSKSLVDETYRVAFAAGQCHAYQNDNVFDRGKLCKHPQFFKDSGISVAVTDLFQTVMAFLSQVLLSIFLFLFISQKPNKFQNPADGGMDASDDAPV